MESIYQVNEIHRRDIFILPRQEGIISDSPTRKSVQEPLIRPQDLHGFLVTGNEDNYNQQVHQKLNKRLQTMFMTDSHDPNKIRATNETGP